MIHLSQLRCELFTEQLILQPLESSFGIVFILNHNKYQLSVSYNQNKVSDTIVVRVFCFYKKAVDPQRVTFAEE